MDTKTIHNCIQLYNRYKIYLQTTVRLRRNVTLVNGQVYKLGDLKVRGFRKHELTASSERISD